MSRFLRLGAFLSVLFFATNVFAAGYTCPTDPSDSLVKQYTSCKAGYYMSLDGSPNTTPDDGNTCTKCEAGYYCPGGSAATNANARLDCDTGTTTTSSNNYWTSAAGASARTKCYRDVILDKSDGVGTVSLTNAVTGATVSATDGTSLTTQCYYDTPCALPTITDVTTGADHTVSNGLFHPNLTYCGGWKAGPSARAACPDTPTTSFTVTSTAATVMYYADITGDDRTITLENNGATTAGTTTLYGRYGFGIYLDQARTEAMTTTANPITLPTKTGYTFDGYAASTADCTSSTTRYIDANGYKTSSYYPRNTATELYACWIANTCTVTFKTGNTTMGTQEFTYGTAQNLTALANLSNNAPVPSTSGWAFYGWATSALSTTRKYTNGQSISDLCADGNDVTLYGIWSRQVTLKYASTPPATSMTSRPQTQYYFNKSTTSAGAGVITLPALVASTPFIWTPVGWTSNPASITAEINSTSGISFIPSTTAPAALYALYKRPVRIVYNGNGATSGSMDPQTTEQYYNANGTTGFNPELTALANGFDKTGYSFVSWNGVASGIGSNLAVGATIPAPAAVWNNTAPSLILYARWKANEYTVAYNSNKPSTASGTISGSTANSSHEYDTAKALTTNGYSLTGWTFAGWNTTADGSGTSYSDGASVENLTSTNGETVTLYARWTANTYTVKYDMNCPSGATCSSAPSSTSCTYDETCTFSSISSTALYAGGYKLTGWASTSTGTAATSGSNLTSTNGATVTRYAIWSKCAAGTYHPAATGTAANTCATCSAGYYCASGASSQTECGSNNKYSSSGASSCSTVTSGYYSTGGTATTRTGQTKCEANNYCSGGVKTACSTLANGFYPNSAAGSNAASDCYTQTRLSGKYVASANATGATDCAAGTFKEEHIVNYGSTSSCDACALGSYSAAGASACTACQNGKTTSGTGKSSCDATCGNDNTYDSTWATATWSDNAVTNLCQIATCAGGSSQASVNGGVAGVLPSGYTQLAYLESTGTQYIDTGVMPTNKTTLDVSFMNNYATSSTAMLVGDSYSSPEYTLSIVSSTRAPQKIGNLTIIRQDYWSTGQLFNVYMSAAVGQMVNGEVTKWESGEESEFTGSQTLKIFGDGVNTNRYARARVYSLIIDTDGTKLNLIPAKRNSDGVLGMYDTVNNTFLVNSGSGTFVAGPAILKSQNTCTQCATGTYSAGGTATSCETCPSGYGASAAGSDAVSDCYMSVAAKKYVKTANDSTATACGTGTYKAAHTVYYGETSTCSSCPSGYDDGAAGATEGECVISVAGGQYIKSANDSTATNCENWTYKGSHTVNYGSTSTCDACLAVPDAVDGVAWTKASGTKWKSYSSCVVSQTPANCASGSVKRTQTSATAWGSTTLKSTLKSKAGYYASTTATSCTICPAGSYCPASATSPTSCPAGYGNSDSGASSSFHCYASCAAGTQVATPGAACTTPTGCWISDAHNVYFGMTSASVNSGMWYESGVWENSSTNPTSHAGRNALNQCVGNTDPGYQLSGYDYFNEIYNTAGVYGIVGVRMRYESIDLLHPHTGAVLSTGVDDYLRLYEIDSMSRSGATNVFSGIVAIYPGDPTATSGPGSIARGASITNASAATDGIVAEYSEDYGDIDYMPLSPGKYVMWRFSRSKPVGPIRFQVAPSGPSGSYRYNGLVIEVLFNADGRGDYWTPIYGPFDYIGISGDLIGKVFPVGMTNVYAHPQQPCANGTISAGVQGVRYGQNVACGTPGAGKYADGCKISDGHTFRACSKATICPAGSYCPAGALTPTACAIGSYTNETGKGACTACSAGTTTTDMGKTSCDATCDNATGAHTWATPSWSANRVANLCKVSTCNANTYYTATTGTGYENTCTSCGSNSSTEAGNTSTTCTCTTGHTSTGKVDGEPTSKSGCSLISDIACAIGEYLPASSTSCLACTAGHYCPSNARTYSYSTSIQGRSECSAGTYQPDTGKTSCIDASAGYYVGGSAATEQVACTGATYAANTKQTSCTACPTATNPSTDKVTGYSYWISGNGPHTERTGCQASFATETLDNGTASFYCFVDQGHDTYGIDGDNIACYVRSAGLTCDGGYYNDYFAKNTSALQKSYGKTLASARENACTSVGAGYWSADGDLTRTACDSGLTTIGYGTAANEAGDCGRKFHAGDNVIYLRSEKRGDTALNVKIGNQTFFGALSTTYSSPIKVKNGSTTYSVVNDWQ